MLGPGKEGNTMGMVILRVTQELSQIFPVVACRNRKEIEDVYTENTKQVEI